MGGVSRHGCDESIRESRSRDSTPNGKDEDNDEGKLTYAPRKHAVTVELFAKSLATLRPNVYLNDEIIQFYTAYLINDCCEMPKKLHVFDNLFHQQLRKLFHSNVDEPFDPTLWSQLKNWFNNVNIFEKEFLVFPVCRDDHWHTIVVCYPNEVRDCDGKSMSSDSDSSQRYKPVAGIIFLDSLGVENKLLTSEVRYFLDFEWRTRCTVIKDFFYHNLEEYQPRLPKQTNSHDCGIFMLAYLRAFVQQPEKFYRLVRMGDNKEAEASLTQMVNNSLVHCGREVIKNLIKRECRWKK